jgi:antitoxin component of MazEF toxin-antitoxin module
VQVARPELSQRQVGSGLGAAIEVRLSNGRSLVVAPGFAASHLRALLAVVECKS